MRSCCIVDRTILTDDAMSVPDRFRRRAPRLRLLKACVRRLSLLYRSGLGHRRQPTHVCTLARERSGAPTLVAAGMFASCLLYPLIKARATFDEMVKNKGYRAFRMRLAQRSNAAKLVRTILLFYLMDNMSSDIFQTI